MKDKLYTVVLNKKSNREFEGVVVAAFYGTRKEALKYACDIAQAYHKDPVEIDGDQIIFSGTYWGYTPAFIDVVPLDYYADVKIERGEVWQGVNGKGCPDKLYQSLKQSYIVRSINPMEHTRKDLAWLDNRN